MKETIKWLADHDIAWLPVLLKTEVDEKNEIRKIFDPEIMRRVLGYTPKMDMFKNFTPDRINQLQHQFLTHIENLLEYAQEENGFWVLALDTQDIFIMDVDKEWGLKHVPDVLKNSPFYRSSTKKLPKIFLMDSKMATADILLPHFDNLKFLKDIDDKYAIEIQKGVWSYMPLDTPIENPNADIPDFNIDEWSKSLPNNPPSTPSISLPSRNQVLKPVSNIPLSFYEHHIGYKLIKCISPRRADDFRCWFDVACALKSSGFSYAFEIWKIFSQYSSKYDERNFQEGGCDRLLWERIVPRRTMGSLHYWAKQDNPELYVKSVGSSYAIVKEREESRLLKLFRPVCFGVVDDKGIQLLSKDKVNTYYENVFFTNDDGTKSPFLKRWLKDPENRCYDGMTFNPNMKSCPITQYNTFTGFPVHSLIGYTYDGKMVEVVLDYIENRLCGGDKDFAEWFVRWMSQFVKEPWKKTRMAVVLKGIEGSGKGLFIMFMKKMIGYVASDEGDPSKFLGRFNSAIMDLLLLCFDEAGAEELFPKKSKLKALISNDTIPIEHKGVDVMPDYPNYVNIIFTTNNDFPVPVDYSDRRYACVESHAPLLTTKEVEYYRILFNNNQCIYSFYTYLCNVDTSSSLLETRVLTTFYKECKRKNIDVYSSFIHYFIQNHIKTENMDKDVFFFRNVLYEYFKEWFNDYNKKEYCIPDINKFWLKILKIKGIEKRVKRTGDRKEDKKMAGIQFIPKSIIKHLVKNNLIEDVDDMEEVGVDVVCP